jgi:hypothetical protein
MRIYCCKAEPLTWTSAIDLLAVEVTIPMWRQSGVPRTMCEKPAVLQAIIRPLRIALRDLSEEAGRREMRQRELGGDSDMRPWYEAEAERIATAGFAAIENAFGLTEARELAFWMIAQEPGVEPYESAFKWYLAFVVIGQDRPSADFVREHVPKSVLPVIQAAFGPESGQVFDQIEALVQSRPMTADDQEILAWDPSTVDPGWPPLRDAVGDFSLCAASARARAMVEVISRMVPEDEWATFERLARDWPGE